MKKFNKKVMCKLNFIKKEIMFMLILSLYINLSFLLARYARSFAAFSLNSFYCLILLNLPPILKLLKFLGIWLILVHVLDH
jgi:hypothetical protein